MQKTNIEWVRNPDGNKGYTWNPVRGCLHHCEYCYAARIDRRFGDGSFTPTFHRERLDEPLKVKKPSRIFVGSMADLFGDWNWESHDKTGIINRSEVIDRVLFTANHCQQHTFIFLTKNPKGMQGFEFPNNCWCGTSVENQEKADERRPDLLKVNCKTLFVSYEPALGSIDFKKFIWNKTQVPGTLFDAPITASAYDLAKLAGIRGIDWLIIGAQTDPGAVKPKAEWIAMAVYQAKQAGIPVFVKDNLGPDMGVWPMPREFPR